MLMIIRIAWRNLWRNTRRTLLTACTVGLGLTLLFIAFGLGDGSHLQMIEGAVRLGSGHVVIQAPGYERTGGLENALQPQAVKSARHWLGEVSGRFPQEAVAPRISGSALASSADGATGVRLLGVDPEIEISASKFEEKVVSGRFLKDGDSDVAVIGRGVARKLELDLGGRMVLMAQGAGGTEIESRLFRVAGVLKTGLEEYDQSLVLAPLESVANFFKLNGRVHQLGILLSDVHDAEALAREGTRRLPRLEVLSWKEALPELQSYIELDDAGNYVFNLFLFLLIAFMVLNTLLMSVLERNREFSLLDALGLPSSMRFAMVLTEAFFVALISVGIGFLVGYPAHLYFATEGLPLDLFNMRDISAAGVALEPVMYSYLSWGRIFQCVALVFGLTMLLALLPARRAAGSADVHLLGT